MHHLGICQDNRRNTPSAGCNIPNTKDHVWPHFQTTRKEFKIRRVAEYFWWTSRCLEVWSNNSLSVDITSQSKLKLKRKRRNKIVKSMSIKIRYLNTDWSRFTLFKLGELSTSLRSKKLYLILKTRTCIEILA